MLCIIDINRLDIKLEISSSYTGSLFFHQECQETSEEFHCSSRYHKLHVKAPDNFKIYFRGKPLVLGFLLRDLADQSPRPRLSTRT